MPNARGHDFTPMKEDLELRSSDMDASKSLFYQQLASMNWSIDLMDDSIRDVSGLIFEEPQIDASHLLQDQPDKHTMSQVPLGHAHQVVAEAQVPENVERRELDPVEIVERNVRQLDIEEEEKVPELPRPVDIEQRFDILMIRRQQQFLEGFREN